MHLSVLHLHITLIKTYNKMANVTNEDLQWVSLTPDTSEQIKELNRKLERKQELITVKNTHITELKAQVQILMRVIKES